MSFDNKIWNSLKFMGLTDYEAKTYLTLVSMVSGTASEISESSEVPRSRIYDILKILNRKGFVEINKTRPIIYTVVPPFEIFKTNKENILSTMDESEIELTEIYENSLSQLPAPIWLVNGYKKIIKKEMEIISRSKESINIRAGFLFKDEAKFIKEELNNKSNPVKVKILASPFCITDGEKIDIISQLQSPNIDIKLFKLPFVKLIVSDKKEMMLVFTKFSDNKNSVVSRSAIGIWSQYKEIAENYDSRFESNWNRER